MTGWAPGPGRARKCARSAGGGPGEPFRAGPGLGLRPAPREASVEAPRRPRPRPARGRAQGGSRASERSFPRFFSGGSRGARSRSERGPHLPTGGGSVVAGGGGCVFREGVAWGAEAPPDSEFISLVINSKLLYSENAVPLIEQAR